MGPAIAAILAAATAVGQQSGHQPPPPATVAAQPAALEVQLAAVRAGIARYRDFEVARREGWRKFGGDAPLVGEHWYLPVHKGGVEYRAASRSTSPGRRA